MKVGFLLSLFLLLGNTGGSFVPIGINCEENGFKGNWTCDKNDDNTFNVTLDCNLLGHKNVELNLDSHNFPINMSRFTIQNCDLLVTKSCRTFTIEHTYILPKITLKYNFTHFHIANIKNLLLTGDITRENYTDPYYILSEEEVSHYLEEDKCVKGFGLFDPSHFGARSLISITLENVLELRSQSSELCPGIKNKGLEQFSLVNSTVNAIKFYLENNTPYKRFEFLMNNVRFFSYLYDMPMVIWNPKAVVKIINSDFSLVNMIVSGVIREVIITGNKFKELGEQAVVVYAHRFNFSGNFIEKMESCSIQGEFFTTEISNNIINQIVNEDIDERPIWHGTNIGSRSSLNINHLQCFSEINQKIPRHFNYTYNFSNNEIHILDDKALELPKPQDNFNLSVVTIFNNAIKCSCQNKGWFEYLADAKENSKQLYDYWTGGIYQNKCLDVQNCTLGQVLKNLEGLCEDNYECPR